MRSERELIKQSNCDFLTWRQRYCTLHFYCIDIITLARGSRELLLLYCRASTVARPGQVQHGTPTHLRGDTPPSHPRLLLIEKCSTSIGKLRMLNECFSHLPTKSKKNNKAMLRPAFLSLVTKLHFVKPNQTSSISL